MDPIKRRKLESAGWTVGTTEDFLGLTPEESAIIEMKLALASRLKQLRTRKNLSQTALANRMGSSQSRVAKMEAGDPSVSVDLLISALVYSGATREDIAETIATAHEWRSNRETQSNASKQQEILVGNPS